MEVLPKGTNIRIFFTKEFSNQSIITTMARDLNVDFSIVWGKLENFSGDVLGSLVISIDDGDRDRILGYLTAKGLNTEVIVNEL